MPLAHDPDPDGQVRSYGFSKLFTEAKLSLATLAGGPIAGLFIVHRNFLELQEFDRARRTLISGTLAILAYYPFLYWLTYRYFGKDLPAYAKLFPPFLLEMAFIAYQKEQITEFLDGGAVRESLFAASRFILAGLMLEALFYGAALMLMPDMRGEKVIVGKNHHELYYEGMDKNEAMDLASTLESMDYLKGYRRMFAKAIRTQEGIILLFPEARDWKDLEVLADYSMLLDDMERQGSQSIRGCFFHDPYSLADTACFGKDAVPLLAPLRNRKLEGRLDVLAKVRGEVVFFRALFEEANRKQKSHVEYERIPTLLIFASNGIATINPGRIPDGLAEAYGSRENARLGIRILAYAFQGLRWPKGDNIYLQNMEILDRLQANLEKVSASWTQAPSPGKGT
ncbi:MAG: hypothetical protein JF616_16180 [Fibrobacteres bacterium]|nr:hypothetical protein [Fibrobacterota bacterium]